MVKILRDALRLVWNHVTKRSKVDYCELWGHTWKGNETFPLSLDCEFFADENAQETVVYECKHCGFKLVSVVYRNEQ